MTTQAADMLAIVNHGPEDYRLERIARPKAKARELVVKIAACGVCYMLLNLLRNLYQSSAFVLKKFIPAVNCRKHILGCNRFKFKYR